MNRAFAIAGRHPVKTAKIAAARILGLDATVTSDGIKLVIGTHKGEGAVCAFSGRDYEEMQRFMTFAAQMPGGSLFFDLGANIGAYAVRVATEIPQIYVVAIEALPRNRDRIRRAAKLNGCLVDVPEFGISDTSDPATIPLESPGRASVRAANPRESITIETTTVDALAEHYAPRSLRMLKIDVDGMCMKTLAGGVKTISKRETIIYFENDPGVPQFLRDLGYWVGSLAGGSLLETDTGSSLWAIPHTMLGLVS